MQISTWVAHDERRLRRTLQFIIRPQVKLLRVLGALVLAAGVVLVVLRPSVVAYAVVALGLTLLVALGPVIVATAMRQLPEAVKNDFHLILDDEWVTVAYPLAESRFRWAGLGRVTETPEGWYVMFGKAQAITIPKAALTEQQQAAFSAFVHQVSPRPA